MEKKESMSTLQKIQVQQATYLLYLMSYEKGGKDKDYFTKKIMFFKGNPLPRRNGVNK